MRLVYVDFDGTLVSSNSFQYIYFCLLHKFKESRSLVSLFQLAAFLLGIPILLLIHLSSAKLRDRVSYYFYKGLSHKEIAAYAEKFFRERQHVTYQKIVNYLQQCKAEGYKIVVVSGSIAEVVKSACKVLGLKQTIDAYITARLEFLDDKASGRLTDGPMVEEEKVKAIRRYEKGWQIRERISISDSYSDLPMLELANKQVLVNPSNKLKRYALEKQWNYWLPLEPMT